MENDKCHESINVELVYNMKQWQSAFAKKFRLYEYNPIGDIEFTSD